MSVDLQFNNARESFFSNAGWAFLLEFARANGWQPSGTTAPADWPPSEKWPGHYDPAEGQSISSDDAMRMADALDRGLNDADRQVVADKITDAMTQEVRAATGSHDAIIQRFLFAPKTVQHWREFIGLACESGFTIS